MKTYTPEQILLAGKLANTPLFEIRGLMAKLDDAVLQELEEKQNAKLTSQEGQPLGKLKLGCE